MRRELDLLLDDLQHEEEEGADQWYQDHEKSRRFARFLIYVEEGYQSNASCQHLHIVSGGR